MSIFDAQYIRQKHDLSWGEDFVLGLIDRTAPISVTRAVDLGTKMGGLTNGTIQKKVRSVIEKGLVTKQKDAEDARLVMFVLTEKGKRLVRSIRDAVK